jgi:putative ABC transport system permease protein
MIRKWLRTWRRNPLLTVQFSFTITVGMAAASALTSLMLALAFQRLPYRDPGQLVEVWESNGSGGRALALSGPDLADFANASHRIFSLLSAFAAPQRLWLLDARGATEIRTFEVLASAFSDLGVRPALGRSAFPDDQPFSSGAAPPAWISYRLWKTRYGGSPSVIGATIGIATSALGADESRMRIVGVLPPRVDIPLPYAEVTTDVWYIFPPDIAARPRQSNVFFGLGRLRPGVTVQQALAALRVIAEHLGQEYSYERLRLPVVQTLEEIAQGPARKTMGLLALGVGFVFLLGCVNLAILMGAEGRRRGREVAIRALLGAERARLWREVAMEKCVLTLVSLVLGVAFAYKLLRMLVQLVPAAGIGPPLVQPPPLNLAVLFSFAIFALAASVVWSFLLVGAARGPRPSLAILATGSGVGYTGGGDSTPHAGRWHLILLAAQAGTGVCLLAAAALTAWTYANISAANLGPDPRHTVLLSVQTRDYFAPSNAQVQDFNTEVLSRLRRLPGTQAIALADIFPPPSDPISFMKQGDVEGSEREATSPLSVSPEYFRTLGIRVLFGRSFDDTDNTGGEPVAIVSLDLAKQNWPSPEQSVGSQISLGPTFQHPYKIVGVVASFTGYWSQKPVPTIFLPEGQSAPLCGGDVILRTSASVRSVATLAPEALSGMPIPATISDTSTMQARWQAKLTRPLARMDGMFLLALLGLGLSVQGVYAVATATVTARTHELAVRCALGAPPSRLVCCVTRDLVLAVIIGSGLGVTASLDLRPLLQHWLGPVAVWRVGPFATAAVLLVLAAAVGCYVPLRTAARTNPAEILREG